MITNILDLFNRLSEKDKNIFIDFVYEVVDDDNTRNKLIVMFKKQLKNETKKTN